MKFKLIVMTCLVMVLSVVSCQKEELDMETAPTTPKIENTINGPATLEERSTVRLRTPLAIVNPVPCGYGFTCHIDLNTGGPAPGSYYYEITDGTNTWNGYVSDGDNTPWVLSPCTSYTFTFWGITGPPSASTQTLTVTTDGCGGNFLC